MIRPRPALALLWTLTALLMSFGAWSALRADPAAAAEGLTPTASASTVVAAQAATALRVPRGSLDTPLVDRFRSLVGLLLLTALAWGLSVDRKRRIPWRVVGWGLGLQLIFGLFILKTPAGAQIFDTANTVVVEPRHRGW